MKEPEEDTLTALEDRISMIFCTTSIMTLSGMFGSILGIIPTLGPFFRDHHKRVYIPQIFFWVSSLYHVPVQIVLVLVYQVIFFFVIGIDQSWNAFLKYFIVYFACYLSGSGYADILSIAIRDVTTVNQAIPLLVLPLFIVAGFTVIVKKLNWVLRMFSYISTFRFAFQAGAIIDFDEEEQQRYINSCFVRPPGCSSSSCAEQMLGNPACNPGKLLDFYEDDYWTNVIILFIHAIVFRIIAAIIFAIITRDTKIPYAELPDMDSMVLPYEKGIFNFNRLDTRDRDQRLGKQKGKAKSRSKL
jgi:hypothetical protein